MKNKKGFTLVELLAVIVVLGLLAAIILPKITDTVSDAEKQKIQIYYCIYFSWYRSCDLFGAQYLYWKRKYYIIGYLRNNDRTRE